ncbi:PREDICTED: protein pitchfork [Thamnophis sirtalis]|uniref:Protein pitchfork n=1 Tax=Thamnophis sirtalis TaxID=35019 RepID=A0A6I9XA85_9SAUR|nr:PREDICTED: protein pitchfork [Thamnophis sirtalis]
MRTRLDFQNYLDSDWEVGYGQMGNSFGSCQEKKIFPFHHAPDRLGNQFAPIKGDPDRGPGTYNHAERNNLIYNLAKRPQSIKGYSMGARTTPRFVIINKACATSVFAPALWSAVDRLETRGSFFLGGDVLTWKQGKSGDFCDPTNFVFLGRHVSAVESDLGQWHPADANTVGFSKLPGFGLGSGLPGTYNPNKLPHRHVSWPGKFGSPDWSLVPMPQRRTFRAELISDKEFKKYRNLVAYLSIYYSD